MKVLLITEIITPPYDEGIKKTVFNLYKDLKDNYNLKVIARYSFASEDISIVNTNALFYSRKVRKEIEIFKPEVLIYIPFASATFASYLRFKLLSVYAKGAKTIFISLQPKSLKKWQEEIVKLIRPKFALTPSPQLKAFWKKIDVQSKMVPLLTDLNTFKPLENESSKAYLRKKYNLPTSAFIISHIGHLNEGRNLKALEPIQNSGFQIVVIGSSSTPKDSLGPSTLKQELRDKGIIVLDGYIKNIEEIYQLSDIYIFPVIAKTGSIGMPLSIMEARACGIPVITTDFGSLKHFLKDDFGGITYAKPDDILNEVKRFASSSNSNFYRTRVPEINKEFYKIIHHAIEPKNEN